MPIYQNDIIVDSSIGFKLLNPNLPMPTGTHETEKLWLHSQYGTLIATLCHYVYLYEMAEQLEKILENTLFEKYYGDRDDWKLPYEKQVHNKQIRLQIDKLRVEKKDSASYQDSVVFSMNKLLSMLISSIGSEHQFSLEQIQTLLTHTWTTTSGEPLSRVNLKNYLHHPKIIKSFQSLLATWELTFKSKVNFILLCAPELTTDTIMPQWASNMYSPLFNSASENEKLFLKNEIQASSLKSYFPTIGTICEESKLETEQKEADAKLMEKISTFLTSTKLTTSVDDEPTITVQEVFKYLWLISAQDVINILTTEFQKANESALIHLLKTADAPIKNLHLLVAYFMFASNQTPECQSQAMMTLLNQEYIKEKVSRYLPIISLYDLHVGKNLDERNQNYISTNCKEKLLYLIQHISSPYFRAILANVAANPETPLGQCIAQPASGKGETSETRGRRGEICNEAKISMQRVLQDFRTMHNDLSTAMIELLIPQQLGEKAEAFAAEAFANEGKNSRWSIRDSISRTFGGKSDRDSVSVAVGACKSKVEPEPDGVNNNQL